MINANLARSGGTLKHTAVLCGIMANETKFSFVELYIYSTNLE